MERMDFVGGDDVDAIVDRCRPDAILHAAAIIDVDLCEREPALARRVNADATGRVAMAAAGAGARLVYFSSDMVFDGRKGMYVEEDAPCPISVYGETKLEGERRALAAGSSNVVARLSLMYGAGTAVHGSFLGSMRARLGRGETVKLFTDQYRSPLFVGDACRAVARILDSPRISGVYHLAGPERMNRFEFGRLAARAFGFPERLLKPIRMDEMRGLLPRPKDNSMDNGKASRELGVRFTAAADGLRASAREEGA